MPIQPGRDLYARGSIMKLCQHLTRAPSHLQVFLQILFDLFLIAALQIFSNERALVSGESFASFIAFFTILWTLWASQAIYDLRFRTGHDIISLLFLLVQLVVFGILASNAAAFNVALGLAEESEKTIVQGALQWVQPIKQEIISTNDRYDALRWISAAYAVSRLTMAFRYAIVALQAKHYGHSSRPILILIGGLVLNATFWFGAFACDLFQNKTCAIVRTLLWCLGIIAEFVTSLVSLRSTALSPRDSEFLLQRYASLTIIVVGEGGKQQSAWLKQTVSILMPVNSLWTLQVIQLCDPRAARGSIGRSYWSFDCLDLLILGFVL